MTITKTTTVSIGLMLAVFVVVLAMAAPVLRLHESVLALQRDVLELRHAVQQTSPLRQFSELLFARNPQLVPVPVPAVSAVVPR